jgi:hypothetical protein
MVPSPTLLLGYAPSQYADYFRPFLLVAFDLGSEFAPKLNDTLGAPASLERIPLPVRVAVVRERDRRPIFLLSLHAFAPIR